MFEEGAAQFVTFSSAFRNGEKPFIFKHLNNKSFNTDYVVLEVIGKNPLMNAISGHISFIEDPSKKAVRKVSFSLEKGHKRYFVHANQKYPSSYIRIDLDLNQQSELQEEVTLVGVIGQ